MRIAALYDVHGNLPALAAVLAELAREPVDTIVAGGDVVWGPRPAECLQTLRRERAVFVRGNCERAAVERATDVDRWTAARLSEEELAFVARLPVTARLGDTLFCHATARSDDEIVTRATPDELARAAFAGVEAATVVCGHTHQQFDRRLGGLRIVNAGSVGLPYEGRPGAYWALLSSAAIELRRTEYDVEAAAMDAEAVGFPQVEQFARPLREPPDPDEVAAYFEGQAGRGT